jgi:hypothetical protein
MRVGAGAVANLQGALSLMGDVSNLTLNFLSGSTSASSQAQVAAGQSLVSAGNMLGAAAQLLVSGEALLSGALYQPRIVLANAGTVRVRPSVVTTRLGDLQFNSTSSGSSNFVISGDATSGQRVALGRIYNCPTSTVSVSFII